MMKQRKRIGAAITSVVMLAGVLTLTTAISASADSLTQSFEGFTPGSPDGQSGWQFTGSYDAAIADPGDFGVVGMGDRAFRISNASTSGSFSDWVYSEDLANDAGETLADGGGFSGGTRQSHFEASFEITSTQATEQAGLQASLAPDRGDGARMSFLRFNDSPGGIDVTFADYLDKHPLGPPNATGCDDLAAVADGFVNKTIATDLSRSAIHDVTITMDFLEGPANDRVEVYIDGALAGTGTSWEDYFRYCEGNQTRPVDSLIFQARDGAGTAPATLGKGFLIDNLALESGPISDPTTDGQWTLYPAQSVTTTTSTTTETAYQTRVRPPINANGSSNWPKKRGVIPVQFDLDAATKTTTTTTTTTGPVTFDSVYSDNTTVNDGGGTCGTGSGADHANDCAFLRFVPDTPLVFTDLTELVADYAFLVGDCHGGSLRWSVSVDTDGNGTSNGAVWIYYGNPPQFGNGGTGGCTASSPFGIDQTGDNLIGLSDVRYDTSQLAAGTQFNTYGGALSLVGTGKVLRASLVLDSGWGGDQRVDLDGATANGTDWIPSPVGNVVGTPVVTIGAFAPTCDLPQAAIEVVKNDPSPDGPVNEDPESVQIKDTGLYFRHVDCKYIYNLDVSSLGPLASRQGTYRVYANIAGTRVKVNPAVFDLRS